MKESTHTSWSTFSGSSISSDNKDEFESDNDDSRLQDTALLVHLQCRYSLV